MRSSEAIAADGQMLLAVVGRKANIARLSYSLAACSIAVDGA